MARRLFIVCLLLCGSVLADKERIYDDDTFSQLTDDLIQEIRKRISDSSLPPESTERCEDDYGATAEENSIIMTRDSLANGAVFVAAPVVTSGPECSQECCDAENCNVAVFKFKDDEQSCYLFDCGNPGTCLYANHTGFTVLTLTSKKTAKVLGKNHEEDLVKLVTTTTLATTTTSTKPPEKDPVPLYQVCDKDCAGSRTVCQLNYCVCQDGYHEQDGACKDAPQPEEKPDKMKSDEDGAWDDNDSQYKHENDDSQQSPDDVQPVKDDNASEYKHQNGDAQESQEPTESNKHGDDNDSAEKAKTNKNPFNPTVGQQDSGERGGSQTHAEQGSDDIKDDDSKPKDTDVQAKVVEVEQGGDVQVNKEELSANRDPEAVQSNQGAVIALALGLSITALLLVFVGCRLRSVKRRLRRGRPLNSNEADYLVNGMYL